WQRSSLPTQLTVDVRLDGHEQRSAANSLGRFSFASLDDVGNGRPATYSRTLNASNPSGGEWLGSVALGTSWINDRVTVAGGVRGDMNRFTSRPSFNPEIASQF